VQELVDYLRRQGPKNTDDMVMRFGADIGNIRARIEAAEGAGLIERVPEADNRTWRATPGAGVYVEPPSAPPKRAAAVTPRGRRRRRTP
jgi:hypothetical protein